MPAYVFFREGHLVRHPPRHPWRHYLVIADESVTIVDCAPALLGGWRFGASTRQNGEDWAGQSADQIVAWKERAYPGDMTRASADQAARVLTHLGIQA